MGCSLMIVGEVWQLCHLSKMRLGYLNFVEANHLKSKAPGRIARVFFCSVPPSRLALVEPHRLSPLRHHLAEAAFGSKVLSSLISHDFIRLAVEVLWRDMRELGFAPCVLTSLFLRGAVGDWACWRQTAKVG